MPFHATLLNVLLILSEAAREREKAQKAKNKKLEGMKSGANSVATSRSSSPTSPSFKVLPSPSRGKSSTPTSPTPKSLGRGNRVDHILDVSGMSLEDELDDLDSSEPPPKISLAREKVLEEARQSLQNSVKAVSLVVIGEYDLD